MALWRKWLMALSLMSNPLISPSAHTLPSDAVGQTAPIVRLFALQTAPDKQAQFYQTGRHNMGTSMKSEAGTLTMFALRDKQQTDLHYVFEIYRDQAAYETHVAAPHFQQYVAAAKEMIVGRDLIDADVQFISEKPNALAILEPQATPQVRLALLELKADGVAAFKAAVLAEMRTAMAKEDGVLAMYAFNVKDQPTQWRFLEVYADEVAYQAHRNTAHFQQYLQQTADLVVSKQLLEPDNLILLNKGNLQFDPNLSIK
ncbi:putative quinol monooxygenase [Pasteurella testudinis]|uniref:putative quinol monooxygenase n=1 Tax=Pasteurella testudinis TaxID=761 RepID=UPI0040599823